ncbi:uncharacterized protein [Choristoneura fumiferana]|uniref:uncharacterized protein n=1 Tax=Choristoneura fumiferana TaxID=7141 RepID=UPI003D159D6E
MNRVPKEVREGTRTPTKREALSAVMSVYDPLGLLSPYTITAKVTLQQSWRKQAPWDEPLDLEDGGIFIEWARGLAAVAALQLERCYAVGRHELHAFTDASESAYATAIYLRTTDASGTVTVALVAGKAKVAPLRQQSIPRMELQAALIGARLAATIIAEQRLTIERVVFWTDSRTVLAWIRNDAKRYTPFVAHRLGEIAEITRPEQWRWVPTAANPADDATRADSARQISTTDRWFTGPDFLRLPEDQWPQETKSSLFHLDPVLEDGLLRLRGRINAAPVPDATKRPVILNGRHPFVSLLIEKAHRDAHHSSNERVVNDLRQRLWVLHLRPTVKKVARACRTCAVRRSTPRPPAMGDLPRARIDPYSRPFTNCGVDYFGPLTVTIGRRHEKRWVALFTCLTTRAVHLEIVASLSTDSAIMALRRMAARRGWPRVMYSDNGTCFRGADTELRAAYEEWLPELRDIGLRHRMEWRFIPPGAPNQGGAWERLVRSVKTALTATLFSRAPKEEVLVTLLAEAEQTVNARPLTHVSVDPCDEEALTPSHFLLGGPAGTPPTGTCDEADRRAWRASQALANHFWARWVREYLPTLVNLRAGASDRCKSATSSSSSTPTYHAMCGPEASWKQSSLDLTAASGARTSAPREECSGALRRDWLSSRQRTKPPLRIRRGENCCGQPRN